MSPTTTFGKDRRITITMGVMISLISVIAGGGATWATMRSDLGSLATKNAEQDQKIARLETVFERLASIEAKLDMLLRKGTP